MVDAHPEVAIPSESHFIPDLIRRCVAGPVSAADVTELITQSNRWDDFHLGAEELAARIAAVKPLRAGDAIRAFFRLYAEGQGKGRWGDKTPGYAESMPVIERAVPEARFIHVIRDGRDVALSILARDWGPDTIEKAAQRWKRRITRARRGAKRVGHYIELRYEDLITDTERELRRVCAHIDLDFDAAMLTYHERAEQRLAEKARAVTRAGGGTTSVEDRMASHKLASEPPKAEHLARWRREMSTEDVAKFERVAGDLLADCGYELGG
jgi:ribosomal protein S28E/S33